MKRGAVVGIIVGAVVLAATAAAVLWWVSSRPQTAEDAARAYLAALESGDAAAVGALVPSPLDEVTSAAFSSADSYVSDARVSSVDENGASATVRADAELAGERRDLSFTLTSVDGRWMLSADAVPAVRVESTLAGTPGGATAVWIGDALVPVDADQPLLPAEYTLQAAPRGILTGATTAAISEDAVVSVDAALAPDAAAVAQEQLDAYIAACTEPASAVPDACGIRVPWAADLTSLERIAFRIEQPPVLRLSEDARTFDATDGVLVATATGAARTGGTGSFTYRADDWALRGSVRFEGDEMVLSVR